MSAAPEAALLFLVNSMFPLWCLLVSPLVVLCFPEVSCPKPARFFQMSSFPDLHLCSILVLLVILHCLIIFRNTVFWYYLSLVAACEKHSAPSLCLLCFSCQIEWFRRLVCEAEDYRRFVSSMEHWKPSARKALIQLSINFLSMFSFGKRAVSIRCFSDWAEYVGEKPLRRYGKYRLDLQLWSYIHCSSKASSEQVTVFAMIWC